MAKGAGGSSPFVHGPTDNSKNGRQKNGRHKRLYDVVAADQNQCAETNAKPKIDAVTKIKHGMPVNCRFFKGYRTHPIKVYGIQEPSLLQLRP